MRVYVHTFLRIRRNAIEPAKTGSQSQRIELVGVELGLRVLSGSGGSGCL
jgi:hypothetical protein